ncbi:MAG: TolC family protein [Gammaproteobacteria bacterium]|nr:TolC family protein [Gammaproteobacteria bacterium]MCI0590411.1 TolC family protein [Gammaproteobacteria bacterium]
MSRIYMVSVGLFALLIPLSFTAPSMPEGDGQSDKELLNHASPAVVSLIEQVWGTHPAVQAAEAALQAAHSRLDGASQPVYNPQIELDAETAEDEHIYLGLSQTIDWADKRTARSRVSNFQVDAAAANYASVRKKIAVQVLDALARYHVTISLSQLADERVGVMQRFFEIATKRYQAGDISRADLDLANLAFSAAHIQLAATTAGLIAARQSLEEASGIMQATWPALPANLPELDGMKPNSDTLLTKSPELRSLRASAEAAKSRVRLAERMRRPDPTVSVRGGEENTDSLVGLNLSVPLFIRNTFRAEVDAASHEAAETEKLVFDGFMRARARYAGAAERYHVAAVAWRQWVTGGQVSLTSRVKLLQKLLEAGELNASDYLVQIRESLDTEVAGAELYGRAWQAWFEWLDAASEVNTWLGVSSQE